MRCQAQCCSALLAVGVAAALCVGAAASQAASEDSVPVDPECTFENCQQCFRTAKPLTSRKDLHFTGKEPGTAVSARLRIARCISYWDSQAFMAHVLGILAAEMLGINVDYVHCDDESTCLNAIAGCLGWMDYECYSPAQDNVAEAISQAVQQGTKIFNDSLADIMVLTEYTPWFVNRSRNAIPTGPTGYISFDGLYTYEDVIVAARQTGLLCDVEWFTSFERPELRALMSTPQQLMDSNITPEEGEGCSATLPWSMSASWFDGQQVWWCKNDWWLNKACFLRGASWSDDCLVVLEDSMNYEKPEIYSMLALSEVPVAKISIGWDPWRQFIVSATHNVTFTWWSPDATALHIRAVRLQMSQQFSTAAIVLKAAWGTVLTTDVDLKNLLTDAAISTWQMEAQMYKVNAVLQSGLEWANDPNASTRVYQKIACDWLRENPSDWESWLPSRRNCLLGRRWNATTEVCEFCPSGKEGVISDFLSGQLDCKDCEAGRFADTKGSTVCTKCHQGRFSLGGNASCGACDVGKFGALLGESSCEECPPGRSTPGTGSTFRDQCVCAADTYSESVAAGNCRPCPDYMICKTGSDFEDFKSGDVSKMRLKSGYMMRESEPGQAYLCLPSTACPGGGLGQCTALRDSQAVACGKGVKGTWKSYRSSTGYLECSTDGTDSLILAVIVIVGLACVVAFAYQVSKPPRAQTRAGLQAVLMMSISVSSLQTMGVFGNLSITWFEPMSGLINFMSWASLDLSSLKLACTGLSSAVFVFILRQMVAPTTVPVVFVTLLIKRRLGQTVDLFPELANAVGSTFTCFFTAIVISAITPFICYPHPRVRLDQTEEAHRYSMVSEPSLLCFRDRDHLLLITAACCSLMGVAAPFLALTAYGSVMHKAMLKSQRQTHIRQLRAFRFLYQKFTPECHYYGLVINLRSLCICLVPVFPGLRNNTALQFCFLAFTVGVFVVLQLTLRPWRAHSANVVDGVLMICNLQLLVCAAIATDFVDKESVGRFGAMLLILFCCVCLLAVLRAAYRMLHRARRYDHFICHHKGGAAAQARLLKVLLQEESRCSVFIDSDNLQELDVLFDVVKTQVGQLVVYLTRETLRRPWCAGEVCTAFQSGVRVVAVKTVGFVPPTEIEMEDLASYIDCRGCNLQQYGIHFEDVAQSFQWLLQEVDEIPVPRGFTTLRWKVVVDTLVHGVKPDNRRSGHALNITPGLLLVSSEPGNDEACASAAIIARKINSRVMTLRELTAIHTTTDLPWGSRELVQRAAERASTAVVLLSSGSLTSPQQVSVILDLMYRGTARVIPVKIPGFEFPNDFFFSPEQLSSLCGWWDPEEAAIQLRAFFHIIAIPLETSGSDAILQRQVDEIFARVAAKSDWRLRAAKAERSIKSESSQVHSMSTDYHAKDSVVGVPIGFGYHVSV